jgi:hypothetical protein
MCANHKFGLVFLLAMWVIASPIFADVINYWRLEEGSGSGTADETGLANGTLVGFPDTSAGAGDTSDLGWSTSVPNSTVPLTGESNSGSLHFAQYGGAVSFTPSSDMNYGTDFTVEFSFRLDSLPVFDSPYSFFGFQDSDTGFQLSLWEMGDGDDQFQLSANGESLSTPSVPLVTDQWYHFAWVRDVQGTGDNQIYIDGGLVASDPASQPGDTYVFSPGGSYIFGTTFRGYDGYFDEIRISNVALTPDQFLNAVPEPSTFLLVLLGLFVFGLRKSFRVWKNGV